MDVDVAVGHEMLSGSARMFLAAAIPLERVRDQSSRDNSSGRSWWRRSAEMGWISALVPEDFGGVGCAVAGRGSAE